ncbi:MAG: CheR family methyltransferase [Bacteroidota bacterium]|nr:CheR family methyltransferase [Bacteroidota bacterium]
MNKIFDAKLSDKVFTRLQKYIQGNYGIKMPPEKRIMLQSRLQKRLRALDISSYEEYIDFAFNRDPTIELVHMMDVVSTNKTDFFREPAHFEFLEKKYLPAFYANSGRQLSLWSAGCSSGEEIYTLAMVFEQFAAQNSGLDYKILGTDISTIVLKKAKQAIYPEALVEVVPLELKRKYMLRSKDKKDRKIRMIPRIRNKTRFERLNFMDASYNIHETFDVIFCRNVLIYFNRETQEKVINKLCEHLKPGGFFFFGHSESITGLRVPLKYIQQTVFQKTAE